MTYEHLRKHALTHACFLQHALVKDPAESFWKFIYNVSSKSFTFICMLIPSVNSDHFRLSIFMSWLAISLPIFHHSWYQLAGIRGEAYLSVTPEVLLNLKTIGMTHLPHSIPLEQRLTYALSYITFNNLSHVSDFL